MRRLCLPLVVLVLAGMLHGAATPAAACICGMRTFQHIVSSTDTIVLGRTIEDLEDIAVAFEVDQYLKGDGPGTLTVNDLDEWNDCTLPVKHRPERQVLFLHFTGETYLAPTCSGSRVIMQEPAGREYVAMTLAAADPDRNLPW